jgi:hypothetical protein
MVDNLTGCKGNSFVPKLNVIDALVCGHMHGLRYKYSVPCRATGEKYLPASTVATPRNNFSVYQENAVSERRKIPL